ncbi:MAG TPA: hypothetical protein H9931_04350 [Candidatus Enterocloster excrementigallinarum]|uniref:Uncharacterized protein n=1 Tax=Candidatus Enterocloster excrementigallinarum TaxID=2838558 RepID=A0A9D2TEU2_9FIRM|nr:hypothetical protein [Candidatus Enterocloster excrementigallinarum]
MSKFPNCFPENFETEILPREAKEENRLVYRIIKYGTINRDSFISTYEEIQRGLIPPKKRMNLQDPGLFSTSCNIDYSEAEYVLNLIMRHQPKAFIAKGETEGSCGPCQLTSEREKTTSTHIDWWIYDDSSPQLYFEEENR